MKLFEWLHDDESGEPPSSPRLLARLKTLGSLPVKRIMVPRALIVALDADVHPRRVRRLRSFDATYLAVYRGDLDQILGWISKTRVLELMADPATDLDLAALARPVGHVDENLPAAVLGDAFLKFDCPFLVVRNREGQNTGLVSLAEYVELVFGLSPGRPTTVPNPVNERPLIHEL